MHKIQDIGVVQSHCKYSNTWYDLKHLYHSYNPIRLSSMSDKTDVTQLALTV